MLPPYPKASSMPVTAPLYGYPPFVYRDNWVMVVVFTTTAETITSLVPAPLIPNPDNLMLVTLSQLRASGFGAYNEAVVTVPCRFAEQIGQYTVSAYLDQDVAMVAGREIWGFPKKGAQVTFHEQQALLTARVERSGLQLAQATMELATVGTLDAVYAKPWLSLEHWFNVKLIPSVQREAPPEVLQLTAVTIQELYFKQIYLGPATLAFGHSPVDLLGQIPIQTVVQGAYLQMDGILSDGRILHDYLRA